MGRRKRKKYIYIHAEHVKRKGLLTNFIMQVPRGHQQQPAKDEGEEQTHCLEDQQETDRAHR